MSPSTSKDFGTIRPDYAFFQRHATEAEADLGTYAPHVRALTARGGPVRVLDFGCGDGGFTAEFLARSGLPPVRLSLALVEPEGVYREQAVERLQPLTPHPVQAWPALPPGLADCFDLVLANHVFYYVPDLDGTLAAVLQALAASGLFLTAIAGQRNTLIQFWNRCFALIGKPVPFHTAEDVAAALSRLGERYATQDVPYQLAFPDSEENRLTLLRFLLGSYFPEVPRPAMVALFDPYARGGTVRMELVHEHFLVRHGADASEPAAGPA
jgi:trans-aconitate 2-methyltransferase